MLDMEQFIAELPEKIEKLKYEQLILGQEKHPRKTNKVYEIPTYIKEIYVVHNFFEICFLVRGRYAANLDKKTYLLKTGDVCLINRGVTHHEALYKKNMPYETVLMVFTNASDLKIINMMFNPPFRHDMVSTISMKMKSEKLSILEAIFRVRDPKKYYNIIKNNFVNWASHLKDNLKKGRYRKREFSEQYMKEKTIKAKRIDKAVKYIRANYTKDLKLNEIAQIAGLSPVYFTTLFKDVYNWRVFEFITGLRMNKAYSLLRDSELNVNEIAFKVGYDNPSFFRRIFKKYTGTSPKDFRMRDLLPYEHFDPRLSLKRNRNRKREL